MRAPAERPMRIASATAGNGTPSCSSTTRAERSASEAARTSSAVRRALAPAAERICFSPLPPTWQSATPVNAEGSRTRKSTSTPSVSSASITESPRTSFPTRATSATRAPSLAAPTAWFAPFPPGASWKSSPLIDCPGCGSRWPRTR